MIEGIDKLLEYSVNKAVDFVYKIAGKNALGNAISYNYRRSLNEILESFYILSSLDIIQKLDDTILRSAFRIGEEVIFEKLLYFGSYYYSKQKLFHGDLQAKEDILRRTNVETASMLSRIRAFQLSIDNIGGSTDDYFISRMPQLLDGISHVIKSKSEDIYIPTIYNLLNLHKTIFYYYKSGHTTYLSKIKQLHTRINSLLNDFSEYHAFKEIIRNNDSVKLFYEQYLYFETRLQGKIYISTLSLKQNILSLRMTQKLRVLDNLSLLNKELFIKYFEEIYFEIEQYKTVNDVENAIIIRLLSRYYFFTTKEILIDLNIKSDYEKIELSGFLDTVFNHLNKIKTVSISKEEFDLLYSYDDSLLRSKVASTIINVPGYEIEREMKKPHGVFEISDMEIRVKIHGKYTYLCIPFKSGKEIKSSSVSVEVMYQILRPFFHFNNCVVVFITAKKCSQNLINEIKRAHDKYGFSIEILEDQQLAQLLKLNGQLN